MRGFTLGPCGVYLDAAGRTLEEAQAGNPLPPGMVHWYAKGAHGVKTWDDREIIWGEESPAIAARAAWRTVPYTREKWEAMERDHKALEALRAHPEWSIRWEDDCECCGHPEGMWLLKIEGTVLGKTHTDPAGAILFTLEHTEPEE